MTLLIIKFQRSPNVVTDFYRRYFLSSTPERAPDKGLSSGTLSLSQHLPWCTLRIGIDCRPDKVRHTRFKAVGELLSH